MRENLTCMVVLDNIFIFSVMLQLVSNRKCIHLLYLKYAKMSFLFSRVLASGLSIGMHPILIAGNAHQWKRSVFNLDQNFPELSFYRMCNGFVFSGFMQISNTPC